MDGLDLQRIAFLIGREEPSVFKEYLDHVANQVLTPYKMYFQYGGKRGESLYTHVVGGIFLLETLRPVLGLSDEETRVLFTAFTVHDINKVLDSQASFSQIATEENVAREIERLGLGSFFPEWQEYLTDITSLVRGHSGHHHAGGERWVVRRAGDYRLGLERVNALLHLMRAADVIDLSHTLEERAHKADFLGYLNAYLADNGSSIQYEFFTHRLTEHRGLLTNVIHNAIVEDLRETYGLIPLLFYPDGVAYLVERGRAPTVGPDDRRRISQRIARVISSMTTTKFQEFIRSTGQGIKVDPKCLELGVPFEQIWREIYNQVQQRRFVPGEMDRSARKRAQSNLGRNANRFPQAKAEVERLLAASEPLISVDPTRLQIAELARSYYIFISTHFADRIPDPWEHIYRLLRLPEERWPIYAYFDARYDRPYVLARDLVLSEEEVYRCIETDGKALMSQSVAGEDRRVALFEDYLARYALFGACGGSGEAFRDHLAHYVAYQHRQCVHCSGPFPTAEWMTADVRDDITVQTFSNRLRGGPGEPKKYICAVCHIQFLLEKLNYPAIRGEKLIYLHLFPYSFLTEPFIQGLYTTVRRITHGDTAIQALNMRHQEAIRAYLEGKMVSPTFRARTVEGKPQPYGLYLPRYPETVGNLLIFPINPAGENDTERFLFALWNALVLQRHFGVKVLLSRSPVAPLGKEEFGDFYVDHLPLSCRGLLPYNDYSQYAGETPQPGTLPRLWEEVGHLFALRGLTYTAETRRDSMTALVRALAEGPLAVFYEVERLLEARVRADQQHSRRRLSGSMSRQARGRAVQRDNEKRMTWLSQQAFPHVKALALSKGGDWMTQLSEALQRLAEIAWQNGLRGRSLERSSLLFPLDEVFQKLRHPGREADREALKAAAAEDIFSHLSRIAEEQYRPGRKKREAAKAFVEAFFNEVLDGVYRGNTRKLLADEKLLRSAFLFYVREQIPRKEVPGEEEALVEEEEV